MSQRSQTKTSSTVVANAAAAADAEVTAYSQGPAIFREKRILTLPAGKSKVTLAGLPETFVANSLTVTDVKFGEGAGEGRLKLGALSYRDASLSLQAILEQAVGTEVTLIERTNAGELKTTGKLLHVLGNQAVLESQGRLTVTPLSDRLALDPSTLAGLSTTASLQLEPTASVAGNYSVSILFAADGLSWNLNYEVFYDAQNEKMARFACWVNLTNKSGADIDAAKIKLIFGANTGYNEDNNRGRKNARPMMAMAAAAPMGGGGGLESASFDVDGASVESVGEQKLYTLPDTLSISHDETKQTLLFLSENVPVTPEYYLGWSGYPLDPDGQATGQNKLPVNVRLKLANSKESTLGLALPPGSVKIFEKDSTGSLQRTDASRIVNHVAAGESFELALATPCKDLKATRRLTFLKDDPIPAPEPKPVAGETPKEPVEKKPRFREEEREIVLLNFKDKDVDVKVQDSLPHEVEFIKPLDGVKNLASAGGAHTFTVSVPKSGQVKLTYRIKYRIG
jgi:hypothetical protein